MVHFDFDFDVLDPERFRALLFTEPGAELPERYRSIARGKLSLDDVVRLIGSVESVAELVGLSITEHLPWDAENLRRAWRACRSSLDARPRDAPAGCRSTLTVLFGNRRTEEIRKHATGSASARRRLNVGGAYRSRVTAARRCATMSIGFFVNGVRAEVDVEDDTPALWVLRDVVGLTGTKFGCGIAMCGACTIHVDGEARRACVTPIADLADTEITTVEGLAASVEGRALQTAWIELEVPQCGYCQSGQLMAAAALIATEPDPSDAAIDMVMAGNICRCGT